MNESSFSLLTQKEIDTLITFLSEKQKDVTSDVLCQDSIDKLIHLIYNNDINNVRLDTLDSLRIRPNHDVLKELNMRTDTSEICELNFEIEAETNFLTLFAKNITTGKEYPITPTTLDRMELLSGSTSWGYSIVPILFDKIARIFMLKYSRDTYEKICSLYLTMNFGSADYRLPSMYCPSSNEILDNLI
ncbi:MAG: hypothetical protein RR056_01445 [Acetivibrio sp.]